jgi:hypothetical protein
MSAALSNRRRDSFWLHQGWPSHRYGSSEMGQALYLGGRGALGAFGKILQTAVDSKFAQLGADVQILIAILCGG